MRRPLAAATAVVAFAAGLVFAGSTGAYADALPVPEGTASPFAVLAGSTITNTGSSTIIGDIGLHPGTAFPGYADGADSVTHTGNLNLTDGVALNAKNAAGNAYTSAAGQVADVTFPTPELNGLTLTRGVYDSLPGTFANSGTLTLDAEGDPSAIFIFQMESTMVMSAGSSISLINGANSCNVYWVVGSSATLGSNSYTVGTIMAYQDIAMNTGATLNGRLWASVGQVTLQSNVINTGCVIGSTVVDDDDDTTGSDDDDVTGGEGPVGAILDSPSQVGNTPTGGVAAGDGSLEASGTNGGAVAISMALVAAFGIAMVWFKRVYVGRGTFGATRL